MTDKDDKSRDDSEIPHSVSSHAEEYARFGEMTGREREELIKRTSRIVFDEEFSRDTTQAAIYRTAEAVVQKIDVKRIIKETAIEVSKEVSKEAAESSKTTATNIAKEVLKEAFVMLDMDPLSRDDAREFRADIRFVRGFRKTIGESWSKAIGIILVAFIGAGLYGAWSHLAKGPPGISPAPQASTNNVHINPVQAPSATPPSQPKPDASGTP